MLFCGQERSLAGGENERCHSSNNEIKNTTNNSRSDVYRKYPPTITFNASCHFPCPHTVPIAICQHSATECVIEAVVAPRAPRAARVSVSVVSRPGRVPAFVIHVAVHAFESHGDMLPSRHVRAARPRRPAGSSASTGRARRPPALDAAERRRGKLPVWWAGMGRGVDASRREAVRRAVGGDPVEREDVRGTRRSPACRRRRIAALARASAVVLRRWLRECWRRARASA